MFMLLLICTKRSIEYYGKINYLKRCKFYIIFKIWRKTLNFDIFLTE